MRFFAVWCLVAARPSTCHSDYEADTCEREPGSQCEIDLSALLQTAVNTHATGDATGVSKQISETKVVQKASDNDGASAVADTDVVLKGASENVVAEKMPTANLLTDLGGVAGGISNASIKNLGVWDQFDAGLDAVIEKVTGSVDTLRPLADTFADTVKASIGKLEFEDLDQPALLRSKLDSALDEVETNFDFISEEVATVRETLMQLLSVAQMSDVEISVGKTFERITGALNDLLVVLQSTKTRLDNLLARPDFSTLCNQTFSVFGEMQQGADSVATETNAAVANITDLIGNNANKALPDTITKKVDDTVEHLGTTLAYVSTSISSSTQALIDGISDAIAAKKCPAGTSGQTLRGGTCSRLSVSSALLLAACVVHYVFH